MEREIAHRRFKGEKKKNDRCLSCRSMLVHSTRIELSVYKSRQYSFKKYYSALILYKLFILLGARTTLLQEKESTKVWGLHEFL